MDVQADQCNCLCKRHNTFTHGMTNTFSLISPNICRTDNLLEVRIFVALIVILDLVFFRDTCSDNMVRSLCLLIFCLGVGICWSSVLPVPTSSTICVYNGVTYNGTFHPSPCYYCHCSSGKPVCAVMDCAFPSCPHTVTKPGHCCPVCSTGTCIITIFLAIIIF